MTVDYEYYKDEYGGNMLSEADFNGVIGLVYRIVSSVTMGRAPSDELPEQTKELVRQAMCRAAEEYSSEKAREGIASENNDGYSVSYTQSRRSAAGAAAEVIRLYLADTGLLYRGA